MQIDDPVVSRAWWGGWVVLRSNLYENGITLAGPPPQSLVEPVTPEDLRQATLANVSGWAEPMLADPAVIDSSSYQSYIVLTLCRMLYTLRNGVRISKPAAVRWALTTLTGQWTGLIERAWEGRKHSPQDPSIEDVNAHIGLYSPRQLMNKKEK